MTPDRRDRTRRSGRRHSRRTWDRCGGRNSSLFVRGAVCLRCGTMRTALGVPGHPMNYQPVGPISAPSTPAVNRCDSQGHRRPGHGCQNFTKCSGNISPPGINDFSGKSPRAQVQCHQGGGRVSSGLLALPTKSLPSPLRFRQPARGSRSAD
jgi:hypothetical protein